MSSDLNPESTGPSVPPEAPAVNPFSRLVGVILSPDETMSSIARKPDWIVPLLAIIAISLATSFMVMPKLDFESQIRAQLERRGVTDEEQIQRNLEIAEKIAKYQPYIAVVLIPAMFAIIGGVLLLDVKVFGGEALFPQAFSVATYSWVPQLIKGIIVTAIVYPRSRIDVRGLATLLKSNLGFLSDPIKAPAAFTFLSSLDVFTFWTLFLIVVGMSKASGFSRTKTALLIVPIWLVFVLARVGLATLSGG